MSRIALSIWIAVGVGVLTATPAAHAPLLNLESCHDDLDRLRRTASDASDAAQDAISKSDEFEDCKRDPDVHDVLGDGCRSRRSDYQSALSDLESKMDDLDARLRSVQSSCEYEFSINRMSPLEASQRHQQAAQRRLCVSFQGLLGLGMPPKSVLQMCEKNMDVQWCKACLGLK
jgi:hypothetical protein